MANLLTTTNLEGGAKPYDFTKLEGWTGGINPNGIYTKGLLNETSTPVVCKDGTKKMQSSSPNAKYMDVCRDNGGRADEMSIKDFAPQKPKDYNLLNKELEDARAKAIAEELQTKKQESILSKISGNYGKNLLIAGVLVIGYFAYKKFKK